MSVLMRHIARLGGICAIGNIAVNGIGFLLVPIYTMYLRPEDYGLLALITVSAALFSQAISSTAYHALTRFYYSPDSQAKQGQLLFAILLFTAASSVVAAGLYWLLSSLLCTGLLGDTEDLLLVRLYGVIVLLGPTGDLSRSYLLIRERVGLATAMLAGKVLTSGIITVYLMVCLGFGVYAMGYGAVISQIIYFSAALVVILRDSECVLRPAALRAPLRYALPCGFAAYADLLMHSGDRYILKALAPLSDVGLYSFGYRFGEVFCQAYVEPVRFASQPTILRAEDDPVRQQALILSCARGYLFLGSLIVLGAVLFSGDLIRLVARHSSFYPAADVVPLIALGYLLFGLGDFFAYGLVMARKSLYLAALLGVCVLVNICLNILLIPVLGKVGAAIATVFAYLLSAKLQHHFARKQGFEFDLRRLLAAFVVLAGAVVINSTFLRHQAFLVRAPLQVALWLASAVLLLGHMDRDLPEKEAVCDTRMPVDSQPS